MVYYHIVYNWCEIKFYEALYTTDSNEGNFLRLQNTMKEIHNFFYFFKDKLLIIYKVNKIFFI